MLNSSSILTIELKCRRGSADLYVARNHLATAVEYDFCALCSPYSASNPSGSTLSLAKNVGPGTVSSSVTPNKSRVARLVLEPAKDFKIGAARNCSLIVGVHGADTGAIFSLWAFATTSDIPDAKSGRVGRDVVRELRELADSSNIEAALNDLVKNTGNEEIRRNSIIAEKRLSIPSIESLPHSSMISLAQDAMIANSTVSQDSDAVALEKLVRKIGREELRRQREREINVQTVAGAEDYFNSNERLRERQQLAKAIDPNLHSDLYLNPVLTTFPSPGPSPRVESPDITSLKRTMRDRVRHNMPKTEVPRIPSEANLRRAQVDPGFFSVLYPTEDEHEAINSSSKHPTDKYAITMDDVLNSTDFAMNVWTGHDLKSRPSSRANQEAMEKSIKLKSTKRNSESMPNLKHKLSNNATRNKLPSLSSNAKVSFSETAPEAFRNGRTGILKPKQGIATSVSLPALLSVSSPISSHK